MKHVLFALLLVSASVTAFSAAHAARTDVDPCACRQDATYTDDADTDWPACVQSFGLSWTPTQDGICEEDGCPTPQACKGDITMSGTGSCSWGVGVWASGSGEYVGASFNGSFSVPTTYSISCGNYWNVDWYAGGAHLGTHKFECQDCGTWTEHEYEQRNG